MKIFTIFINSKESWMKERMDGYRMALKGVDGRSKWRAGTRETEVRLDGWCEGGLGQ